MNARVRFACVSLVIFAAISSPAFALCDGTPPDLTGFTFTPSSINTTSSSQVVTCNMTVTDDLSGASAVTCSFQSPSFMTSRSCSATVPTSGTPTNGTYSCAITFPRYSESGTWTASVGLSDAVGNSQTVFPQFLGFPFALTVTSDPDTIAPALTGFNFTPTSVNVSAAAQSVTCNMTVTDAKSGVDVAFCQFQAPTVSSEQVQGCAAAAPSTGTRNSGTFSCVVSIPRYADAGAWTPGVFLRDLAGNFAAPAVAGTLTVTAVPEDVVAPSLTSFSIAPASVDVSSAAKTVTCTMGVSDALAGVNAATCTVSYTDPFNPLLAQSQSCTAAAPSSGTRNSGTFQCIVTIPRYSTGGLWDVDVSLVDLVGNTADLPQPEQVNVACDGGAIETTVRFDNKTTLAWDAVAGADRYNVYRGDVSGLVDANLDHLPDGGYGTCQNSRDPDLTDTSFIDADVPSAAQKGFDYLVSYTIGGVEQGLGSNSFGDPRTVATPCP